MSPFIMRRTGKENDLSHVRLRLEDQAELCSGSGLDDPIAVLEGIVDCCDDSWFAYSRKTGELVAIFGYEKHHQLPGRIIWFVGTTALMKNWRSFCKVSKKILDNWLDKFGMLHNFIDSRNTMHIWWLDWLGFDFPIGLECTVADGTVFQYFVKEK